MTKRPTSHEPPLHLDMDFEEALGRFTQVDKKEADEVSKQSRKKSPSALTPKSSPV